MIKVLHFISDKNIGGAGKLLLNQVSAGNRSLFEYVIVLPEGSALLPLYTGMGVRCIPVRCDFNSLMSVRGFRKIIAREKPEIVHTHSASAGRISARLCGVKGKINTKHCADENEKFSPLKKGGIMLFDRLFTDRTIATADYVERKSIESGISQGKLITIINGSIPLNRQKSEKKLETRTKYGFSEKDFIVGLLARMEDGKGHEILIEAARICQLEAPEIKFILAGNGTKLLDLVNKSSELYNLQFVGFIRDVTDIMNILDVNCCCSYVSETSSLSLSEGMSLGVIPVVSDCGGNAFMAEGCGIVVPKKSPRALADALIKLSRSPEERTDLSENAAKRFLKYFSAEEMTLQVENLYLSLLKNEK